MTHPQMMRGALASALVVLAVAVPPGAAQEKASAGSPEKSQATSVEAHPASSNVPGASFPRIHSDLRITFQFKAPQAKNVQVQGGEGLGKNRLDMARDANGVWTVTTPPVVPGFHY